ncbi:MAG: hypothetical protein JWM86_2788 [Thermoleophilia bacterium]|nr:hypothetical protein [Thermoleophilia bacterium]
MSQAATIVFVEHVLWTPDDAWRDALEHLAGRFARVAALDVDEVLELDGFAAQVDAIATWAESTGADPERELGRWFDEHLSLHVRPAPTITRAVRALAAAGEVHLVSALPDRAAESITRHAGCWRSVASLTGDVRDAAALGAVLARHPGTALVADAAATPIPAGVDARALSAPAA